MPARWLRLLLVLFPLLALGAVGAAGERAQAAGEVAASACAGDAEPDRTEWIAPLDHPEREGILRAEAPSVLADAGGRGSPGGRSARAPHPPSLELRPAADPSAALHLGAAAGAPLPHAHTAALARAGATRFATTLPPPLA